MIYRAFLSYSRTDDRQADWLHHRLESFRTPKSLIEDGAHSRPPNLLPIFRDRTDMSGGGQLSARIVEALTESEALIVLCSRASAVSHWVNTEVKTFIGLGRMNRIFPVIVADAPDSDDVEQDFFPPALRGLGLIAADLRAIEREKGRIVGDGRQRGRVKLIAGLINAPLDALLTRERNRKRIRTIAISAASIIVAVLVMSVVGFRYVALRNEQAADVARARIFAERSWEANGRGNRFLAARYALAGWRRSPGDVAQYRSALARTMHDANDTLVIFDHRAPVTIAVFSRDGSRVATSGEDDTAKVWAADTGELLLTLAGHGDDVLSVAFSPDGTQLVTASKDGTARIWDARSGRALSVLRGHQRAVVAAAFSPDGHVVVTASDDTSARLWNARTGVAYATLAHEGAVGDVTFSPDGAAVLTASLDGSARMWSVGDGHQIADLGFLHSSPVVAARFSADGRRVAFGRWDRTAVVREVANARAIGAIEGHPGFVTGVAFSPDGARLATSSWAGTVLVTTFSTGRTALLEQQDGALTHPSFSRDGAYVVAASSDGEAYVWEVASGRAAAVLYGHEADVNSILQSPDGARLLTSSDDGTARLWRSRGRAIGALNADDVRGSDAPARADACPRRGDLFGDGEHSLTVVASSDDASRMIVAIGSITRLWEPATRRLQNIEPVAACATATSAAFAADRSRLALMWDNGAIEVRNVRDASVITTLRGQAGAPVTLTFTDGGRRLAVASSGGVSTTWDASSGRLLSSTSGSLRTAGPNNGGREIVFRDGKFFLWNSTQNSAVVELAELPTSFEPVISADGMRVAAPGGDNSVRVLSADTGRSLTTLRGHQGGVVSAMFSTDGTRIVTASLDQTSRIWDAVTGREMAAFEGHGRALTGAFFSPDNTRIVTRALNETIRVWDVQRLTQSMDRLSADACTWLLRGENQQFSATDVAADNLIEAVWLRGSRRAPSVCS